MFDTDKCGIVRTEESKVAEEKILGFGLWGNNFHRVLLLEALALFGSCDSLGFRGPIMLPGPEWHFFSRLSPLCLILCETLVCERQQYVLKWVLLQTYCVNYCHVNSGTQEAPLLRLTFHLIEVIEVLAKIKYRALDSQLYSVARTSPIVLERLTRMRGTLRGLRQGDLCKLESSLGYKVTLRLPSTA